MDTAFVFQLPITVVFGSYGIEILARHNIVLLFQHCMQFVTAETKSFAVNQDWHIRIVVGNARLLVRIEQPQPRHTFQMLAISQRNFPALRNKLLYMRKIAQTHSGLKFIHLRISAHIRHMFFIMNPKIFIIIEHLLQGRILINQRSPLNGVKQLCRMEAVD